MKCLLEKLKVEVSDSSLPVIETINPFTRAAIAASGNTQITEGQTWALNRFFSNLGAFNNSALWRKIDALVLPMICNKNLSTALTNYVGNVVVAAKSGDSFSAEGGLCNQNGGLNTKIASYKNNANEVCVVALFTVIAPVSDVVSRVGGVKDTTYKTWTNYVMSAGGTPIPAISIFSQNVGILSDAANNGIEGFGLVVAADSIKLKYTLGGDIYSNSISYAAPDVSYSDGFIMASGSLAHPLGMSITAHGLTADEAENILVWAKALKNAFVTP